MRNSLVFSVPVLSSSESSTNAAAAKTPFPLAIKMRRRPWGARHVHCDERGRAVVRDVKVENADLEGNREEFGTGPRHIDPGARAREQRRPNATANLISSRRSSTARSGCEAGEADRADRGLSDSGKSSQGWNWTNTGSEFIIDSCLGVKGSWGSSRQSSYWFGTKDLGLSRCAPRASFGRTIAVT